MTNVCETCGKLKTNRCICGKIIKKGEPVYILVNKYTGKKIGLGKCCIEYMR